LLSLEKERIKFKGNKKKNTHPIKRKRGARMTGVYERHGHHQGNIQYIDGRIS